MRAKAGVPTVAERRRAAGRTSEPMAVRSVRLPDKLWHKLGEALMTANVGRRQPITLSILIRSLIERGLLHSDDLDEIGTKAVVRPRRVLQQTALEKEKVVVEAEQKVKVAERAQIATSLFGQVRILVKARALTYRAFLKSIMLSCDNPDIFEDKKIKDELFNFFNGFVSDESAISTVVIITLRRWIEQQDLDKT